MSTHPDPQTADADQLREAADDAWERGDWRRACELMAAAETIEYRAPAPMRRAVSHVERAPTLDAASIPCGSGQ